MKTFEQFLLEASNNVLYTINANPELKSTIIKILKDKDYRVDTEGNNVVAHPKDSDKLSTFKDMLYASISDLFAEGDETMIKFVGSSRIDDLIDSDLFIDVEATYK